MASPRREALLRHLRGVRRRLLWVLVAWGVGGSLTWHFRKVVLWWLMAPANGLLSATGMPIFTSPTEMFAATVKIAILGGILTALPVLVVHVIRFVGPLLTRQQRRFATIFLVAGALCYLAGAAFAYFILLPTGLRFLLQFGTDVATPTIRLSEYINLALAMLFWLGIVFELPLAMFTLAKLRLVSYEVFKKFRRYVPVTAFILAAIITPTFDIVNQILVAVPLLLLFEVGMFLAWLVRPRQRKLRQSTLIASPEP